MLLLVRRTARTRVYARNAVLTASFRSSAPVLWKKKTKRLSGLADDLTPTSPSGSIHLAPKSNKQLTNELSAKPSGKALGKRPAFERDPLPHTDTEVSEVSSTERNPSFRRRSTARSEQDWDRRTGRWTASNYGGGMHQGSQMGIREDRPQSYGLRSRPQVGYQHRDESSSRTGASTASSFPRDASSLEAEDGLGTTQYPPPWVQPSQSRRTSPRKSSFGLRPDGETQPGETEGFRPAWAQPTQPRRNSTPKPSFGLRSLDAEDRPSSSRHSTAPSEWDSERSRDTWDPLVTEDSEVDDALVVPQSLKNRNQPSATPSSTPAQKSKPDTPPPPKPPKKEISLFEKPSIYLTRAGVPIVTKSDPVTASTTESYSPAMGQRNELPTKFSSPPLLPGLLSCLHDVLGPLTPPTPIQALSLKWVLDPWTKDRENVPDEAAETDAEKEKETQTDAIAVADTQADSYKEFLLASETGSGKSIAYLLPMLQALKLSEARRLAEGATPIASKRGLNPRALILAPTHELARQLSLFAKALLHDVKLRVLCASRANNPTRTARDQVAAGKGRDSNASRMKALVSYAEDGAMGEFQVTETDLAPAFPIDVVVGTPMKLMEMVRGRGWEKEVEFLGGPAALFQMEQREQAEKSNPLEDGADKEKGPKRRRGRDSLPGVGKWRSSPEMGLSEVEWVIIDEADILFDSDFQETTRLLLADIAKARGREVSVASLPVGLLRPAPPTAEPVPATSRQKEKEKKVEEKAKSQGKIVAKPDQSVITPHNYPFNFLVASATIPNWLSSYLNAYHPALQRLVSPNLHRLPKTLKTEYVGWTGGNKNADIERRLRKVWAMDAAGGLGPVPGSLGDMSKVLIFCNKNNKVEDLGAFLEEKGIKNVQLGSASPNRQRGSNKHLDGFLKGRARAVNEKPLDDWSSSWVSDEGAVEPPEAEAPPPVPKGKDAPRSLVPLMKQGPPPPVKNDPMNVPHVMITTSLLSRGLDFSPNIKYVFIVDEPRNMIDFLHRAGRTGRAGANGKVVIFGKLEGRGSQKSREVKQRIKALVA
ncbi:hypothetical protein B0H19DRAFT_174216 [Mycena capillaripes]|nr:hypothetical protein B0H19DRAFT_174216 [Mycena capillaripes]